MEKILETEFKFDKEKSTVTIKMKGTLEVHSCQEFKNALTEEVNLSNILHMIIDLSELTYIDSTGIGVLIGLQKRWKEIKPQARLALIITNKNIKKIFRICGLNKIFDIFENIEKAEESLCEECDPNAEIQKSTDMALSSIK